MTSRPKLAVVQGTESANARNVVSIRGIRSHGPADGVAPVNPSSRKAEWRNLMRLIGENQDCGKTRGR
jgi:hypothetical protein